LSEEHARSNGCGPVEATSATKRFAPVSAAVVTAAPSRRIDVADAVKKACP